MLVIRKSFFLVCYLFAMILAGCSDPGTRALFKGERFINEGKYQKAVPELQRATRLLPRNAQAWNHLGLAFHQQGEFLSARHAYVQALNIDFNLAAARYNLGCLLLENKDIPAAIDQLTSYTLLQPRAADGWLKLATAQLRARRLEAAEKGFKTALELSPNHPEALNGLGNVHFHRRRNQDALNFFNRSLEQNPEYAPAMLNAAIVTHQTVNNRPLALQFYRRYLAHDPFGPNANAVAAVAKQLDEELNHANLAQAQTNVPPPPIVVKTNPAPAQAALTSSRTVARAAQAPAATNVPAPKPSSKEAPIQVSRLSDDLAIRPTQDVSPASAAAAKSNPVTPVATKPSPTEDTAQAKAQDKRGLLARLNPFTSKPKTNGGEVVVKAVEPTSPAPAPVVSSSPKYRYLSPERPAAGNRREADKYFASGVKAQRSSNPRRAAADYAKAVELDPSYFEAHYNRGLATYDLAEWSDSLRAYEHALAIRPDSTDARYNFALALKAAGYVDDAAQQLSQIIKAQPNESRAHLSLANLYAYRLNQPKLAHAHFTKVLEVNPRHPQAAEIRFWLASHPL